jgi:hypothetical protein
MLVAQIPHLMETIGGAREDGRCTTAAVRCIASIPLTGHPFSCACRVLGDNICSGTLPPEWGGMSKLKYM